MREIIKVDRVLVKDFIQKDSTITCPVRGDYWALMENGSILSVLCVTDHIKDEGCYMIQSMRTEKKNRGKGYSTALVKNVIQSNLYCNYPIRAHALEFSKNIFSRCGFRLLSIEMVRKHLEWTVEYGEENGKTKT